MASPINNNKHPPLDRFMELGELIKIYAKNQLTQKGKEALPEAVNKLATSILQNLRQHYQVEDRQIKGILFKHVDKILDSRVTKHCAACNQTVKKILNCSRCKLANYCDKNCQRAHWPVHKKVCKRP